MALLLGLSLTTCIIGVVVAIVVYYWYKSSIDHYWKRQGVASDEPTFGVKNIMERWKGKTIWDLDAEQYKKHGKISGIYFGASPMLLVSDPELVKNILVKDFHSFEDRRTIPSPDSIIENMMPNLEGQRWREMRAILTPVFTSGKLRKLSDLINRSALAVTESFLKSSDDKTPVELKKLFGGYSLDVIASTAFGTELDSIKNPDNIFAINAQKIFTNFNWRILLFVLAPKLCLKFRISTVDSSAIAFFSEVIVKIREQRINGGKTREDLLGMLMDIESQVAEEDHDENHYGADGGTKLSSKRNKKSLTRDELVAQCVVFFLAGHDATSSTLALVCYLMALHPDCQERLQKEVDQIWEKHEGKMDFDVVNSMKYLEAVIAETLRYFPLGSRLERKCVKDYVLGDTGITIPKDMFVGIPVYSMHKDPEYFPEPEKFDPERFLPENKDFIKPYTYLPFGSGPRGCIGRRFAMMEVKLCLVHAFRHVTFYKCPETQNQLEYFNGVPIMQPKAITVGVKRRS